MVICLNKVDLVGNSVVNKIVIVINEFVSRFDYEVIIVKSAFKRQIGLPELRSALISLKSHLLDCGDSTFVTNERHYQALLQTSSSLAHARQALTSGTYSDLVAEDLRLAISSLNQILGQDLIDPETVLHEIFRRHCIGK